MNSPTKDNLVKALCKLSAALCSYTKQPCDCKFIKDEDDSVGEGHENGSGCPETMIAAELIAHMNQQEFKTIAQRAGINIGYEPDPVDTFQMKKKFQEEIWKKQQEAAKLLLPAKRVNRKSAYVPGKLPKGIL